MSAMVCALFWQHVAEIDYENEHIRTTRGATHGTVTHLNNIGLLGPNLLAAHSVWLDESEVHEYLLTDLLIHT